MKDEQEYKFHIEQRIINDLIPYKKNPRTMSERHAKGLERSLRKYGVAEIPVINTDNKICAGHQRLKILQMLGRGNEKINVSVPNKKMTKKDFEDYNIISNLNIGDWDKDILANEFDYDDLIALGFLDEQLKGGNGSEFPDEEGEVEFTEELLEEHNYVVLYFNNSVDWLRAKTLFGLKTVKALDSKKGFEKKGIGRVIDGVEALDRMLADV